MVQGPEHFHRWAGSITEVLVFFTWVPQVAWQYNRSVGFYTTGVGKPALVHVHMLVVST